MKKRIRMVSVLLIVIMLVTGCGNVKKAPELIPPIENPDAVFTAKKMELKTVYMKDASICPEVIDLTFDYDSPVFDVQVKVGDFVKEGDILFRLDETIELRLQEAEVNLDIRKRDYEIALKDHKDQVNNLKNLKNMFSGMNDWYNYNLMDINIREMETRFSLQYDNIAKSIEEDEKELTELREKFESSVITAPADGQIVYLTVHQDDDMIYEDVPVVSIAKQDKKLLCCDMIEMKEFAAYSDAEALINGKLYPVKYVPYDEEEYYEKKFQTDNLYSYFEIDNLPNEVEFGDYAVLYLTVKSNGEVLSVPSQALTKDANVLYVKVVSGDRQGLRPVTIGFSNRNYTEITSGLSEGETVFVANNLARYGVTYETVSPQVSSFSKKSYIGASRKSTAPIAFFNPAPGEVKESYVPNVSQVYVKEGQKLYTVETSVDETAYEEAKHNLQVAQDNYKKKVRDDKESLDRQKKNLNNMSASKKKDLAKLKYEIALKEYEKYKVDGQEQIDELQKKVDAFETWSEGDYTVYAEKEGFYSTFSKVSAGTDVTPEMYVCDYFTPGTEYFGGRDENRLARYGLEVIYEYQVGEEVFDYPGRIISGYDVRPEINDDANQFCILLDDGDKPEILPNGSIIFNYCSVDNVLTVPTELVLRERRNSSVTDTEETTEEDGDNKTTVSVTGNKLTEDEKQNGVPYVWVYDDNGQVVKRYISIAASDKTKTWVADGLTADDRLVIH